MTAQLYQWTKRDRIIYFIALLPFLMAFCFTFYLLATISLYLPVIFILFFLGINIFQAGCCVGCSYVGRFCPAVFGVYLANILSSKMYKQKTHKSNFFKKNAFFAGISVALFFTFPFYWLFNLNWHYLVVFYGLMIVHLLLLLIILCPKCDYNKICPAGKTSRSFKK